jgi:hypothetical protein
VLPEADGQRIDELLARKYRVDRVFILPVYRLVQRLRGRRASETKPVWLAITPT